MRELLINVQNLKRIYDYYRAQFNGGRNPVVVPAGDVSQLKILLERLSEQTRFISPTISAELDDIRRYLFLIQGPMCSFNPFRFGALGTTIRYLLSDEFACDSAKYIRTPWQDINDAVKKLLVDANSVSTRIDYNQVGVAARELYIMLAQKVFTPEVKKVSAEKNIGTADAKGMLNAFFEYKVTDDDIKKFAIAAVKLAESLTHTKSEKTEKMRSLVMAVISLTGIVDAVFQS